METENLTAFFLHKKRIGETSALVHLFTKELGLVNAYYRGGLSAKKGRFLQPFIPLYARIKVRKEECYVENLEEISLGFSLQKETLFIAMYMNELLYKLFFPLEPCETVYSLYYVTLQRLEVREDKKAIEQSLRYFEIAVVQALGAWISFTEEADTGLPIIAEKQYQFVPERGLIAQEQGFLGADILAFSQGEFTKESVYQTAKWLMRIAISHLLKGKPLHSKKLFLAYNSE